MNWRHQYRTTMSTPRKTTTIYTKALSKLSKRSNGCGAPLTAASQRCAAHQRSLHCETAPRCTEHDEASLASDQEILLSVSRFLRPENKKKERSLECWKTVPMPLPWICRAERWRGCVETQVPTNEPIASHRGEFFRCFITLSLRIWAATVTVRMESVDKNNFGHSRRTRHSTPAWPLWTCADELSSRSCVQARSYFAAGVGFEL